MRCVLRPDFKGQNDSGEMAWGSKDNSNNCHVLNRPVSSCRMSYNFYVLNVIVNHCVDHVYIYMYTHLLKSAIDMSCKFSKVPKPLLAFFVFNSYIGIV